VYSYPTLEAFEPFVIYHRAFLKCKEDALAAAMVGDVQKAYALFSPYINIQYCFNAVAKIMRIGYIKEIESTWQSDDRNAIDWRGTLNYYVSLYGIDEEIMILSRLMVLEKYLQIDDASSAKEFEAYFEIPQSILIYPEI